MQEYCYQCMQRLGENPICPHCGFDNRNAAVLPYHMLPGTVLADRYIVGRAIGEGGFGITYIGLDKVLSKRIAVKEFYPSGAANRANTVSGEITISGGKEDFYAKGMERFLDEARNVAACSDEEGIVDVHDFFRENTIPLIL